MSKECILNPFSSEFWFNIMIMILFYELFDTFTFLSWTEMKQLLSHILLLENFFFKLIEVLRVTLIVKNKISYFYKYLQKLFIA